MGSSEPWRCRADQGARNQTLSCSLAQGHCVTLLPSVHSAHVMVCAVHSLRDCRKWQPLGSGCARTAYADSPRILSGTSLTDCLRCSDCAAGSGQNGTAAAVRQSDGHGEYDERASRNGAGWLGKRRGERGLVGLSCEQALNILGTTQHRISALRHRFRRGRGCRCSTQRRRWSRSSRTARCTRCLFMRACRQPPGNVDPFLD